MSWNLNYVGPVQQCYDMNNYILIYEIAYIIYHLIKYIKTIKQTLNSF